MNLNVSKTSPMVFLTTGKETLGQFHPYVKDAIKGPVSGSPPQLKLKKAT